MHITFKVEAADRSVGIMAEGFSAEDIAPIEDVLADKQNWRST